MSEALDHLAEIAVPSDLALQLVKIVGPRYSVSVYETFTMAKKKRPGCCDYFSELGWQFPSIHHLNRQLRLSGYRSLPIDLTATDQRYAIRACHGLRYLAKHAPFPDGS